MFFRPAAGDEMTSENPAGPECVISLPGTQTVCIYFRTMEKTGAAARASPLLSLPPTAGVLDLRRGQLEPVTSPLQPARLSPQRLRARVRGGRARREGRKARAWSGERASERSTAQHSARLQRGLTRSRRNNGLALPASAKALN